MIIFARFYSFSELIFCYFVLFCKFYSGRLAKKPYKDLFE